MKIIVVGKGQLGAELLNTAPEDCSVIQLGRPELDITCAQSCNELLHQHAPVAVINAAAYTAVDMAESDAATAFAVNAQGVANLAEACHQVGARLWHVSTDFVFDGKARTPYSPESETEPLGVYGASKLAGELAVRRVLDDAVIVRTSWLYSIYGKNFVKTMLRLMAEKPLLHVVSDQTGAPTWGQGLAHLLWQGVQRQVPGGIYHWSDDGAVSWYDFAVAIQALALELGLLRVKIPILPVASSEYPAAAVRPAYSVLDTAHTEVVFGVAQESWRLQLRCMLQGLA